MRRPHTVAAQSNNSQPTYASCRFLKGQRPRQPCPATLVSYAATEGPEKGQRAACPHGLAHTCSSRMGTTGCRGHASAWIGWLCLNLPGIMAASASLPPSPWSVNLQVAATSPQRRHAPSLPLSMGSAVFTTPSQARAGCAARFLVSHPHASSYLIPASRRAP
jgi:hypothetical protein